MKNNHNRLIRVFVSSTFSDMNNERDYLMTNVFPQLKEIARRRNVTFVELDLRWGIPDEDTRNGKVLQTCLDAIRDSKPFFIGIVGNRVGWCPTMEEIKKNPALLEQYPEIVKDVAFVVSNDVESDTIKSQIKKSGGRLLDSVEVFDLYQMENEKSIAYTLTFKDNTRTLSDEEVMEVFNKIIKEVEEKTTAKLRS